MFLVIIIIKITMIIIIIIIATIIIVVGIFLDALASLAFKLSVSD